MGEVAANPVAKLGEAAGLVGDQRRWQHGGQRHRDDRVPAAPRAGRAPPAARGDQPLRAEAVRAALDVIGMKSCSVRASSKAAG
jgi:hypothetical protein